MRSWSKCLRKVSCGLIYLFSFFFFFFFLLFFYISFILVIFTSYFTTNFILGGTMIARFVVHPTRSFLFDLLKWRLVVAINILVFRFLQRGRVSYPLIFFFPPLVDNESHYSSYCPPCTHIWGGIGCMPWEQCYCTCTSFLSPSPFRYLHVLF